MPRLLPALTLTALATSAFAISAPVLTARQAAAEPGLILDLGAKFDKSLNEAAFTGAERWAAETGERYREIQLTAEAQREQTLRRMAERGFDPVVVLGFANASTLDRVAPEYPDSRFAIIDVAVDQPNVRSVVFAEHEGSYLAGVLAAMASQSGTIGFVGGMDIPLIRRFACGYLQGARATNPEVTVLENMTGTTPAAWNDPVTGGEITRSQIAQGADVIYAPAGGTAIGVMQAAADAEVYSIGVDFNQNHLHPGSVLTSIVKRVDQAVFDAFADAAAGSFAAGTVVMDLAADGVGYVIDDHNRAEISAEMEAAADAAKAAIIAGEIAVHDYTATDSCDLPAGAG